MWPRRPAKTQAAPPHLRTHVTSARQPWDRTALVDACAFKPAAKLNLFPGMARKSRGQRKTNGLYDHGYKSQLRTVATNATCQIWLWSHFSTETILYLTKTSRRFNSCTCPYTGYCYDGLSSLYTPTWIHALRYVSLSIALLGIAVVKSRMLFIYSNLTHIENEDM